MTSQPVVPAEVSGVDLVYAWVDGDDPQLQADIRRYASVEDHLNPERTRDLVVAQWYCDTTRSHGLRVMANL